MIKRTLTIVTIAFIISVFMNIEKGSRKPAAKSMRKSYSSEMKAATFSPYISLGDDGIKDSVSNPIYIINSMDH